jgi:hypothetical protein
LKSQYGLGDLVLANDRIQDWIQELRKHEEKLFPYPYASTAKAGSG